MPTSTEQSIAPPGRGGFAEPRSLDRHLLRPGTVALIAASLAALAAGAFPELILPAHRVRLMPAAPVLQVVLAVQAGYLLCICPLLMARRAASAAGATIVRQLGEFAVLLAASCPLYLVSAWLSDATAWDVARAVAYLACVGVGALGLGLWASSLRAGAMTTVSLLTVLAVLAAPAAAYALIELAGEVRTAGVLMGLSPVTAAAALARRSAGWSVVPLWAWLIWPAVGAAAGLLRWVMGGRSPGR